MLTRLREVARVSLDLPTLLCSNLICKCVCEPPEERHRARAQAVEIAWLEQPWLVREVIEPKEMPLFFSFYLCLSRACLGKKKHF